MRAPTWAWALFGALLATLLALDLRADRRRWAPRSGTAGTPRALTLRAAAAWSAAWIGLGLAFAVVALALDGPASALTYLTAYLLEETLSADNLLVFVVIFRELAIPAEYQRRVLSWGILGALALRGLLVASGVYLLDRVHWTIYPLAALVLLAAARLLRGERRTRGTRAAAACAACGSWVARLVPFAPAIRGGRFWTRQDGRLVATPLFIALVVVEATDVVFAMDSVPAVLSVTREPFLVYTSNVFALLGLRSLYFLLAGAVARVHGLRYALGAILVFVGAKMLLSGVVEVPGWASLAVIAGAVLATAAASARRPRAADGFRGDTT